MSNYLKYGFVALPLLREPVDLLDDPYVFVRNVSIGNYSIPLYSHPMVSGMFTVSSSFKCEGRRRYVPVLNSIPELLFLQTVRLRLHALGKLPCSLIYDDDGVYVRFDPTIRVEHVSRDEDAENLTLSVLNPNLERDSNKSYWCYGRKKSSSEMKFKDQIFMKYHFDDNFLELFFIDYPIGDRGFCELKAVA